MTPIWRHGVVALVAVLVSAGCGNGSSGSRSAPETSASSEAFAGRTRDGLRIVFRPRDGRMGVRVKWRCDPQGPSRYPSSTVAVPPAGEPTLLVEAPGTFDHTEEWKVAGGDGDFDHTKIRLRGRIDANGKGSGKFESWFGRFNGQGGGYGSTCESGSLDWTVAPERARRASAAYEAREITGLPETARFAADEHGALWALITAGPDQNVPTLARLDSDSGRLVDSVELRLGDIETSRELAMGNGSAWLVAQGRRFPGGSGSGPGDCKVLKVDPAQGRIVATIPICPLDRLIVNDKELLATAMNPPVVAPDGGVFVAQRGVRVVGIDMETGRFTLDKTLGDAQPSLAGLAVDGGTLWVTAEATKRGKPAKLFRVDRSDEKVVERISLEGITSLADISTGGGITWLTAHRSRTLWQVGPGGAVHKVKLPLEPYFVVADETGAWLGGYEEASLYHVDRKRSITEVDLPLRPHAVVPVEGRLWVLAGTSLIPMRTEGF